MSKHYKYFITIHNVRDDCKPKVEAHIEAKPYVQRIVALEPYPDKPGHHIHVVVEYPNKRYYNAVLKDFQNLSKFIMAPRPEGEERDWGRVHIEVLHGKWEDSIRYFTDPKKDKPLDPNVEHVVAPKDYPNLERKWMFSVFHFIEYGEEMTVYQYCKRMKADGRPLNPFYQHIYDTYYSQIDDNIHRVLKNKLKK